MNWKRIGLGTLLSGDCSPSWTNLITYGWPKSFDGRRSKRSRSHVDKFCGTGSLSLTMVILLSMTAAAEVLDKMPTPTWMTTGMLLSSFAGAVFIFLAFRFRLWAGILTSLLVIGLCSLLPDDDPYVRAAVLKETGKTFAVVYYGRWLLLLGGILAGFKIWKRRHL